MLISICRFFNLVVFGLVVVGVCICVNVVIMVCVLFSCFGLDLFFVSGLFFGLIIWVLCLCSRLMLVWVVGCCYIWWFIVGYIVSGVVVVRYSVVIRLLVWLCVRCVSRLVVVGVIMM